MITRSQFNERIRQAEADRKAPGFSGETENVVNIITDCKTALLFMANITALDRRIQEAQWKRDEALEAVGRIGQRVGIT